jgi:hypothetical protein
VKVLFRRSLYTRSLTGLLKFGTGARASSIPMFLAPGTLETKRQVLEKKMRRKTKYVEA